MQPEPAGSHFYVAHPQRSPMGHNVFGCDICQDVCPWNRRAPVTADPAFAARNDAPPLSRMAELTQEAFREMFGKTPIARAKYAGFLRNVAIAMGTPGSRSFGSRWNAWPCFRIRW